MCLMRPSHGRTSINAFCIISYVACQLFFSITRTCTVSFFWRSELWVPSDTGFEFLLLRHLVHPKLQLWYLQACSSQSSLE
jgi:hypothetical protein